ncbi:hypothetical protein LC607_21875 [Nostoc sp. CHAB 5824]|nr:hypothetical protein [Nostoc sp. CHAB 5824]
MGVPDGKSLLLVGGDINMDGGGLFAFGAMKIATLLPMLLLALVGEWISQPLAFMVFSSVKVQLS